MTALAANIGINKRGTGAVQHLRILVKNGVTVYANAHLSFTAAANTVEPCTNDAAANVYAGVADGEDSRNSFPIVGDGTTTYVHLIYNFEMLCLAAGTVDAGDLGRVIYAADDATVSDVSSLGPIVGPVSEFVASTSVWVWIRGAINGAAAS